MHYAIFNTGLLTKNLRSIQENKNCKIFKVGTINSNITIELKSTNHFLMSTATLCTFPEVWTL